MKINIVQMKKALIGGVHMYRIGTKRINKTDLGIVEYGLNTAKCYCTFADRARCIKEIREHFKHEGNINAKIQI
jgi:hypothetical protein